MSGAQQLNILRCKRCAAARERHDVVKVQFICGLAQTAPAAITFPDFQFHRGWNDAPPLRVDMDGLRQVLVPLHSDEAKLEYRPVIVTFLPRIDKVKDAVIRPDAGLDLFIHPNALWGATPDLEVLRGLMEFAVLSEFSGR